MEDDNNTCPCPGCRRFGLPLGQGVAILPAVAVGEEGSVRSGAVWDGVAPISSVFKCKGCGYSRTMGGLPGTFMDAWPALRDCIMTRSRLPASRESPHPAPVMNQNYQTPAAMDIVRESLVQEEAPEIRQLLEVQGKTLASLHDTITMLEARLAPVRRPLPAADSSSTGKGTSLPAYSAVGCAIDSHTDGIASAKRNLEDILDSLAV